MTNQAVLSLPQADSFRELTAAVLERTRNPVDKYEIAATLESMGWNDKMAGRRFGAADVFSLAERIWDSIQKDHYQAPVEHAGAINYRQYFLRVVRSFLRGSIFALPMAVSVTAMITICTWRSET